VLEFAPPTLKLGAHIAPLGMKFYTRQDVPADTATISSSPCTVVDRSTKQGYNVMRVVVNDKGRVIKSAPFLTAFCRREGRSADVGPPVDVLVMRDGRVASFPTTTTDILYRFSYAK